MKPTETDKRILDQKIDRKSNSLIKFMLLLSEITAQNRQQYRDFIEYQCLTQTGTVNDHEFWNQSVATFLENAQPTHLSYITDYVFYSHLSEAAAEVLFIESDYETARTLCTIASAVDLIDILASR